MNRFHRSQRGITLVELMIVMVLAMTVSAAVLTVFSGNRQSFRQGENILRMQDDARHAMRELAFDLTMAGHFADLLDPEAVTPDPGLSVATDCGPAGTPDWVYQVYDGGNGWNLSVATIDNASGADANANFNCIPGGEVVAGADLVAVKRVAGGPTAAPAAGQVYLRTNGTVGLLHEEPTAAPAVAVPAPFAEWEYRPRVYYLRNYANSPGDGIPTLCRKTLSVNPATMSTECLAVGVENLQLEFGIDETGNGDPDFFLADPTPADLQSAVAARIYLLVRTVDPDFQYENEKTYTISNALPFTPGDRQHRRVLSMTVGLKNLRSLHMMGT